MQFFYIYLISIYLLISLFIAGNAKVLKEFLIAMVIMGVAIVLIFHYLI